MAACGNTMCRRVAKALINR